MHSHNGCAPLTELRFDWTYEEIETIYNLSLPELIFRAQSVHRRHHNPEEVQGCTLLSIKTGGCPEDCAYCPQSAHYQTGVARHALLGVEETLVAASKAKEQGASRFCMGAAWRDAPNGKDFDNVLAMVRGVRALGLEACCTLGMLNDAQAEALAEAGLTAYNHNLDTSPEFYGEIISTRTYEDRLATLARVRNSGVTVCSGGIIGLGETRADRYRLLEQLARQQPHPESVPINLLVKVEGTPLADQSNTDPLELVRMIATARILMPASMVRLSAGRLSLSDEAQALCFLAGANSIFMGEKLLTTPNPERDRDRILLAKMGMRLQGNQLSVSQAGC
ncbi:MAG TPA: biotin synthase BioB [Blastocatellia bacterium]|nr:biotin synthase BioB [Blastocatellia bacterium]HMV87777.1 biotin synthase BioB [Blastocatellia bacterium]HMZ20990.1 biotin synthase BioB [Blastocatellia bacterium]HNG30922.1 biotin synthase BioB [Blastocatellia bacterium]